MSAEEGEKVELLKEPTERLRLLTRIEHDFKHHPPRDEIDIGIYEEIRQTGKRFALVLVELVPPGRELSTALTKIEEAVMHANAGYARLTGAGYQAGRREDGSKIS